MKYILLTAFTTCFALLAMAQKREEGFDYSFKPAKQAPYYYVVTEQTDSLWHRQAYYISQKTMAMEGWYKDDSCKIPQGVFKWFHTTRFLKTISRYADGKKEGTWLEYDDSGILVDSANYQNDHLVGVRMKWYKDGMPSDSMNFDGKGIGVQVSWYNDGPPSSAGHWINDTVKNGRWKYFYRNGTVRAIEDYANSKKIACSCFDDTGKQLDAALCEEKEAVPNGGLKAWQLYLEKNLQGFIQSKANAGYYGEFTIVIRFLVDEEGNLTDLKALTQYGNGFEDELIKILKKAPRWTPGQLFGRNVKSYHTQPISFVIRKE